MVDISLLREAKLDGAALGDGRWTARRKIASFSRRSRPTWSPSGPFWRQNVPHLPAQTPHLVPTRVPPQSTSVQQLLGPPNDRRGRKLLGKCSAGNAKWAVTLSSRSNDSISTPLRTWDPQLLYHRDPSSSAVWGCALSTVVGGYIFYFFSFSWFILD